MSQLLRIGQAIQRISSEIVDAERAYSQHPNRLSCQLELESLVNRKADLERSFTGAAAISGVEVCRYSLSGTGLTAVANAFVVLAEFQKLITTSYCCLMHGKRSRMRFSDADVRDSSLGYSHAMAGSLVTVFTLPNVPRLFEEIEPVVSEAVGIAFNIAKSASEEDIKEFADQYGKALVSALYDWSELHARFSLIADIAWTRPTGKGVSLLMQPQQFRNLAGMIRRTGGDVSRDIQVTGILVAANITRKTFAFAPDDKSGELSGTFFDAIGPDHVVELPRRYQATITEQVTTVFATDEQKLSYFLEELVPV